jgi:hypothetical protein
VESACGAVRAFHRGCSLALIICDGTFDMENASACRGVLYLLSLSRQIKELLDALNIFSDRGLCHDVQSVVDGEWVKGPESDTPLTAEARTI